MRINIKRKVDWEEEEQSEREDYSYEESDKEEPLIKDVLDNLSQAVPRKRASELLHSMATVCSCFVGAIINIYKFINQ